MGEGQDETFILVTIYLRLSQSLREVHSFNRYSLSAYCVSGTVLRGERQNSRPQGTCFTGGDSNPADEEVSNDLVGRGQCCEELGPENGGRGCDFGRMPGGSLSEEGTLETCPEESGGRDSPECTKC